MGYLPIAIAVIFLSGCTYAPPLIERLDRKRVVIEGRWNDRAKGEGQINCVTEPKVVEVWNIANRPHPLPDEMVRVTAVLNWRGPAPGQREDEQAATVGYYIDWLEAKWEKRNPDDPVSPPHPE